MICMPYLIASIETQVPQGIHVARARRELRRAGLPVARLDCVGRPRGQTIIAGQCTVVHADGDEVDFAPRDEAEILVVLGAHVPPDDDHELPELEDLDYTDPSPARGAMKFVENVAPGVAGWIYFDGEVWRTVHDLAQVWPLIDPMPGS